MANIKISELEKLTNVASDDYFPIVDSSAGETKKTEINSILNLVFPIGRGFIDFTDTDYSNYLGFTWERELIGMTPIGLDVNDNDFNTIGKTGGEKEHKLTIEEMPSHNHAIKKQVDNNSGNSVSVGSGSSNLYYQSGDNVTTNSTGGNQPHNNLQPYQVVAYWKRIA